jgi:Flp pilus assembly protein TadB
MRATKQMQAAQERELRAQSKARAAVKAESRRQDSIEWSQQQRQKKQAKATATAAARKAQGGGLLPKEKFWIYGGLLLFWVISVITCVQDGRWVSLVFLLAVGAGVGYLVYTRKIKAKCTPPPSR